MSEAEATKPVEAVQPEAAPAVEEKPEAAAAETTESKTEDTTEEKPEEKPEEKKPEEQPAQKSDSKILKTTAQTDFANPRNNRKFDPNAREVSDDPVAIRKQVEFYFGDWNFPQDKFMWESCGGSENKPMKLKTIHSFKRMRTFQPYSAIVAALKDSKFLELSGEEGEEELKRKVPYKPIPSGKAKAEAATVYVKGFGDEQPNTQFDLESFFAKFGEVNGLKLRRTNEGLFKGSVFVTFADEETATKFLALDPVPTWKEHDLKIMSKKAYCDEKSDLIRQGKLEPNQSNSKKFFEGRDGSKRGDSDDWKKRRDHDQRNGFRGGRGGRGGRGRGRGGRGRGRGGRGGCDRDGGRRDRDDRRPERKENNEVKHSSNDTMPRIQSTADAETNTNGKRARENDGVAGEPAAKKADVKE